MSKSDSPTVQLRLTVSDRPILNDSDGPMAVRDGQLAIDRGQCPTVRPCPKTSCRYHLWADDERPGRPHHGKSPPPKIKRRAQSCALDVADQGEHSTDQMGKLLDCVPERICQVEDRALAKLAAVKQVTDYLEEFRPNVGARMRLVYPEQMDTHRVAIVVVLEVDGAAWRTAQADGGVYVRRKAVPK